MRLADLRLRADPASTLELHPHLSVVTGLSPAARSWLVRALVSLLEGRDSGLIVNVDIGGRQLAFDGGAPESVVAGDSARAVRPQDLLQSLFGLTGAGSGAAEAGERQLVRARRAAQQARSSLQGLEQALERARVEYRGASEARERATAAIDAARADQDPYAWAAREAARQHASMVEVEVGAAPGACLAATAEQTRERIATLERQLADLAAALDMVDAVDTSAVMEALDLVRVVTATGPVVPPEAIRLADEWVALREHLGALEAQLAAEDGGVQSASDRLEQARQRLARAERSARPTLIDQADIEALEVAHEQVLRAERRATGRIVTRRAKKNLESAVAAEREILERIGYPTWSSYIMGVGMLDATVEHRKQLEAARAEVEAATLAWERLSAKLEADPEFSALLDRLERVHEAAMAIVGDVDDVESALRNFAIDPGPPPCSAPEARDQLARALVDVGFEVDDDASLDELTVHAESWLAEVRTVASLRRQLEIDHDRCAEELDREREQLDRLETLGPPESGDGFGHRRLAAAREAVLVAQQRLDRHRDALTRLAHLVAEAEAVRELERQLGADLEAKEELTAATRHLAEQAERRSRDLEARVEASEQDRRRRCELAETVVPQVGRHDLQDREYHSMISFLAQRLDAARTMSDEPVPLVLEDPLQSVPTAQLERVLGWLEAAASQTQIIYVTDRAEVVDWASNRSPQRVGVVQGRGAFAAEPARPIRSGS